VLRTHEGCHLKGEFEPFKSLARKAAENQA
jgi:hypothetical protein